MKKRISRKALLPLCGEIHPEDGIDPRYLVSSNSRSQRSGRIASLCQQVRKTLSLVLAGDFGDDRLASLEIVSVEPASKGGRLLVLVRSGSPMVEGAPDDLLQRLEAVRPYLRQEVARSIQRRRAPDFLFEVMPPKDGAA